MAARRGKSQARRHGSGGLPGWAWLVLGVLVTLLAVLLVPRWLKSGGGDGFFRPTPNPDARPAAPSAEGEAIAPDVAPAAAPEKPKPPQFDFYTLLPGQEVAMSDAELAASAKAEAVAYGASGDAEAVKAKIALLGLNARVESAQIAGKTVYRVRLGPYGSAAELAEAKAKLADGGLPAIAVKTQ